MEKSIKKPNHSSMPVKDTPGAKIITYNQGKAMTVGAGEANQSISGLKNLVPEIKRTKAN